MRKYPANKTVYRCVHTGIFRHNKPKTMEAAEMIVKITVTIRSEMPKYDK